MNRGSNPYRRASPPSSPPGSLASTESHELHLSAEPIVDAELQDYVRRARNDKQEQPHDAPVIQRERSRPTARDNTAMCKIETEREWRAA
jgi:hypothetical protein